MVKRVIYLVSILIINISLYAENRVRIETSGNRVEATIELANNEYIIKNENFLYLLVESDEYDFSFDGYPEGQIKETGEILYAEQLILSGELTLREGVEPDIYTINVIIGYQSCDEEGNCFIPVEVAESIEMGSGKNTTLFISLIALIAIIFVLITVLGLRKRRG